MDISNGTTWIWSPGRLFPSLVKSACKECRWIIWGKGSWWQDITRGSLQLLFERDACGHRDLMINDQYAEQMHTQAPNELAGYNIPESSGECEDEVVCRHSIILPDLRTPSISLWTCHAKLVILILAWTRWCESACDCAIPPSQKPIDMLDKFEYRKCLTWPAKNWHEYWSSCGQIER